MSSLSGSQARSGMIRKLRLAENSTGGSALASARAATRIVQFISRLLSMAVQCPSSSTNDSLPAGLLHENRHIGGITREQGKRRAKTPRIPFPVTQFADTAYDVSFF